MITYYFSVTYPNNRTTKVDRSVNLVDPSLNTLYSTLCELTALGRVAGLRSVDDGESRFLLNSDILAMRDALGGVM